LANAVIADTGVLVGYLSVRDRHHEWALQQTQDWPPPWLTCDAVLTETFFTANTDAMRILHGWLRNGHLKLAFSLSNELEPVLALMERYADIPMSLADACIVRMTEIIANPVVLTTDSDFRVYRRHGRHVIPCRTP
jgi:predicted nucleic acid-binding protein